MCFFNYSNVTVLLLLKIIWVVLFHSFVSFWCTCKSTNSFNFKSSSSPSFKSS